MMTWIAIFILVALLVSISYLAGSKAAYKETLAQVQEIDAETARTVEALNHKHTKLAKGSFRDRARTYLDD